MRMCVRVRVCRRLVRSPAPLARSADRSGILSLNIRIYNKGHNRKNVHSAWQRLVRLVRAKTGVHAGRARARACACKSAAKCATLAERFGRALASSLFELCRADVVGPAVRPGQSLSSHREMIFF